MFKLTIEDDEGKTTIVPVAREEMTIGRLDGNTIRLTERNVSRRHARLLRQNGGIYIEDLSSFTGVRVNGAKIADLTPLRDGDEVQIGDYRIGLKGERPSHPLGDRPTMPQVPIVNGPMGTVGGSVAIPTRGTPGVMAAQPQPLVPATPTAPMPIVPAPVAAAAPAAAPVPSPPAAGSPPTAAAPSSETDPYPSGSTPTPVVTMPLLAPAPSPPPLPAIAVGGAGPGSTVVAAPSPATGSNHVASPAPLRAASPAASAAPASTPVAAPPAAPGSGAPVPIGPAARKSGPTGGPGPTAAAAQGSAPIAAEAQPTIPIGALGDTAPLPIPGPCARLFVLTTDLAGREYRIDRASQVIGRTEENDIVLGHRSISRHHARVVREAESYTIVDLQSANGVRVNGEDYERIELHPSDVIELGHVKLRFVGAQESYVFDPRAAKRWRVSAKVMAGMAGFVSMLVLAAFFYAGGKPGRTQGWAEEAGGSPTTETTTTPPVAASAAPMPAAPARMTPAAMLAEAKEAVGSEDWEKARGTLDRLGGTAPQDPNLRRDVLALRRRLDTERQGAALFAKFDEASSAKNYVEALGLFEQIPADSVYKRRARPRFDEARSLVIAEQLTIAERARNAGRCAEVKTAAAEITRLDPRNTLGKEMIRLCRPRPEPATTTLAVAARPARPRSGAVLASAAEPAARAESVRRPEAAPEARRSETSREGAAGGDGEDAEALMKQAREAWLRQQCGSAVDLSRKALHAKPGLTDAYQIIAVCSCTLKDTEAANRAYAKLDDRSRNLVRSLCQKNGVTVGE